MPLRALKIPVVGDIEVKNFENFEALRQDLGGWVERVRPRRHYRDYPLSFEGGDIVMLVDEDGLGKGLQFNPRADVMYGNGTLGAIHGDVFLLGEGWVDGDMDFMDYPYGLETIDKEPADAR